MKPIEVDGENITIHEKQMHLFQPYKFRFLNCDMVAVLTPNGVEILQEIQYETDKQKINNEELSHDK